MATFIKAGFWEQLCVPCKGYKGWLNLDEFVNSRVVPGPPGPQGPAGVVGGYLGSFYDITNQTGIAGNVLTMNIGNSDTWNSGVSITSGNRITIANPGVYNIAFSAQMVKMLVTLPHMHTFGYHKMVLMYLLVHHN